MVVRSFRRMQIDHGIIGLLSARQRKPFIVLFSKDYEMFSNTKQSKIS